MKINFPRTIAPVVVLAFLALLSPAFGQSLAPTSPKYARITSELDGLHRQVDEAIKRHDKSALERLYAEEFKLIHTTGDIDLRDAWITKCLTVTNAPPAPPTPAVVHMDVYRGTIVRTTRADLPGGRSIWWTWIYVKRDGRWQIAHQHGSAVAAAAVEVKVDPTVYELYKGKYRYETGVIFNVFMRDGVLIAHNPARAELVLQPESETRFHIPGGGATYTFFKNDKGEVTHIIVHRPDGKDYRADKIE